LIGTAPSTTTAASGALALQIKQQARELGFDLVGITGATPPPHADQFQQWLRDDFHGEMAYLERNAAKRVEPQKALRDARSVIVVGVNYGVEAAVPSGDPVKPAAGTAATTPAGRIARYASGARDYHDLLGEKLGQLAAFVRSLPGSDTQALRAANKTVAAGFSLRGKDAPISRVGRDAAVVCGNGAATGESVLLGALSHSDTQALWYIDTGPVLERDLAQRAGIGFIGKHTNLISRTLGNWIFIGEVLTNLELPADAPEREYCGTCYRCIDACPTRAIVAPYRLDARLCISYLTIELKGSIPVELRPLIGDRIFGCDDCLEVCPWNRFAKLSPIGEFQRRELPPMVEFLSWDEPKFREFFRGTPIFRIKRRGFLRNVCVALGNVGDASALPALEGALDDQEPLVREHAAWAIDQIRRGFST
jgi:epoxyqueuosine reductase